MGKKHKKGKKKAKPSAPEPYQSVGFEISPDVGVIQAAQLLDIAAFAAEKSGDISDIVKVSQGWLQMSGMLAGIAVAQGGGGDAGDMQSQIEFGFRGPHEMGGEPVEELEEVDDRLPMGFRSTND